MNLEQIKRPKKLADSSHKFACADCSNIDRSFEKKNRIVFWPNPNLQALTLPKLCPARRDCSRFYNFGGDKNSQATLCLRAFVAKAWRFAAQAINPALYYVFSCTFSEIFYQPQLCGYEWFNDLFINDLVNLVQFL